MAEIYNQPEHHNGDADWTLSHRPAFSHPTAAQYGFDLQDGIAATQDNLATSGPLYNYQYDNTTSHQDNSDFTAADSTATSTPYLAVDGGPEASSSTHHKKHKKSRSKLPLSPNSGSSSATPASSRSKLRSASRASKNTGHNPPATDAERKNRASHNQVEKQYRNRLNAHFERLLDALPENMRSYKAAAPDDEEGGGGGGSGGVGSVGGRAGSEVEDMRRVSKAEVLEIARRYIEMLERECAALEGERDELRGSMERLRWLFGRCEGDEATEGHERPGGRTRS